MVRAMTLPAWTLISVLALAPGFDDPEEVDFATLSDFDYTEGMTLPKKVTKFDGKKVKVSGFMATEDGGPGPSDYFLLINDACGCEGVPMLNEVIFCVTADGKPVKIEPGTVFLTGTLEVSEERDYGVVVSLYRMVVDKVDR